MQTNTPWTLAAYARLVSAGGATITPTQLNAIADQLEALSRIHAEMDGREWDGETMSSVAEDLRGIDSCDCDSRSWHGEEHDSACPLAGLSRA